MRGDCICSDGVGCTLLYDARIFVHAQPFHYQAINSTDQHTHTHSTAHAQGQSRLQCTYLRFAPFSCRFALRSTSKLLTNFHTAHAPQKFYKRYARMRMKLWKELGHIEPWHSIYDQCDRDIWKCVFDRVRTQRAHSHNFVFTHCHRYSRDCGTGSSWLSQRPPLRVSHSSDSSVAGHRMSLVAVWPVQNTHAPWYLVNDSVNETIIKDKAKENV